MPKGSHVITMAVIALVVSVVVVKTGLASKF